MRCPHDIPKVHDHESTIDGRTQFSCTTWGHRMVSGDCHGRMEGHKTVLKRENCDLLCFDLNLTRHKSLSVQLSWWPEETSDLYLRFRASTKGDHAGINLSWHIVHLMFNINLYDVRHWDDEGDRWERDQQDPMEDER